MNIFQALREDHDKQRALAKALLETHGDHEDRRAIFAELKAELMSHAVAEERHFYVPLIEDDNTQEKARHAISEHHEMDEMIEELDDTDMSSPHWMATAKHLVERLEHHLDEEEHEFFQMAGKVLDGGEKETLSADFKREKQDYLKSA